MDLSVIIPTFNRQPVILQSVQAYFQALADHTHGRGISFELIIVDDASPDHTFSVLQGGLRGISNIHLVKLKENGGPGVARNAGVRQATGKWIWFLDDDDKLNADGLQELLSLISAANESVDVIAHSLKNRYGNDGKSIRLQIGHHVLAFHEKQEVFNYIFRRSLIEAGNLAFSSGVHEDIRYVFDLIRLSREVVVLPVQVVQKQRTSDAITATMNTRRIDGYIQAYNEVSALLQEKQGSDFLCGHPHMLLDQTLGVILYLISREPDAKAQTLLAHLATKEGTHDAWSTDMQHAKSYGPKATNFKAAGSLWRQPSKDYHRLAVELRGIFSTRLSCKDLDNSLFLAPDEIRACCKRFFVGGLRKGDVVLLKAKEDISLQDIQNAKDDLISRINTDQAPECSGCPYIERRERKPSGIDYISFENFAYCNMRCTYCSPKYYGGTEALYNATDIITQLTAKQDGLDNACHVVWGGGEPTLSPRFKPVNDALMQLPQVKKMRILSNSLKYSENLYALLADERVQLVTSLDAGTQERFQEIRGKGKLDDVIENLQRYRAAVNDKRRVTVKYIMRPDNLNSEELQAFVEKVQAAGLLDSMFHISCDFNIDKPVENLVCAIYELSVRLFMAGVKTIFFDDLIRDRVRIDNALAECVSAHLEKLKLDQSHVLKPTSSEKIVLWGDGKQSDWYLHRTTSGKSGRIMGIVADGAQFSALNVDNKVRIFPSGVQSMYEIIRNIEACGLSNRIDCRVIL